MGADRVRPRTANGQQKLAVQQQPMKRRGAPSKYSNGAPSPYQNGFAQQQTQTQQVTRSNRYEDPESEPEFKAAKRVQSADLLAQLKVPSLKKYCRVHKIGGEDLPNNKEQLLNSILYHWKRQVVDDKQVLRKFAFALHEKSKQEQVTAHY